MQSVVSQSCESGRVEWMRGQGGNNNARQDMRGE